VSKPPTPVMITKNAQLIPVWLMENAPTYTLFPQNAQLEEIAKRISTAKLGSTNKNLMQLASPQFVMQTSELAQPFQTEKDVLQKLAPRTVQPPINVKMLNVLMMSTKRWSANILEKLVLKRTTNASKDVVIAPKDVFMILIEKLQVVKPQFAKTKLTVTNGLSNKDLKQNAKKLLAIKIPPLAKLF